MRQIEGSAGRELLHAAFSRRGDYMFGSELIDVVYEELEMSLGPILTRIRPEWIGLHIKVSRPEFAVDHVCSVEGLMWRGEDDFHGIRRG